MLNVAEIARDADINQKQAKGWLGILETLESGAMNGAILENYVVAEVRKTFIKHWLVMPKNCTAELIDNKRILT